LQFEAWRGEEEGQRGGEDDGEGESKGRKRFAFKVAGVVLLFFAGIVTMAMTENTIQLNEIDLSDTPLGSTSQLIPFLTGLLSFLSTLYSCVKRPVLNLIKTMVGLPMLEKNDSREHLLAPSPSSESSTQVDETGYFNAAPYDKPWSNPGSHWAV